MARYYCAFCSSRGQACIPDECNGMACKNCGEDLVKVSLFNLKKVSALIVASAFIAPLLAMVFYFIKENTNIKNNVPVSLAAFSLVVRLYSQSIEKAEDYLHSS